MTSTTPPDEPTPDEPTPDEQAASDLRPEDAVTEDAVTGQAAPPPGPPTDAERAAKRQRKQRRKRDRFGAYALGLGLAAIALSVAFWPYLLLFGLVAATGAIVLASLSRKASRRGGIGRSGRATAGLVLGVVAIALGVGSGVGYAVWDDDDGETVLDECVDDADDVHEVVACVVEYPELAEAAGLTVTAG